MLASLRRCFAVLLVVLSVGVSLAQAQYFTFGKNKVHYRNLDWYYIQSTHFDVYYYEPGGRYLAEFTARAAETAYEQISEVFQHDISDRIPILVYQNHSEFAVTNAVELPSEAEGIGGVTELFKNRIAIPFTGDYRDFRRVIHHELVHAVINDMFYGGSIQSIIQNNIQLNIPPWFNEGLAEYLALGWDSHSDMYIRDAILNDYLAPIPYLSGYFAYRGGQSLWDYIAEQYGREKIGEILQNLRMSRSVEGSFKRATGLTLEELSERWHKALKEVHWSEMTAREEIEEISRPLITRKNGGYYNTSPALSPQGDLLAFISTRDAFFDVFLARTTDGKIVRKLVDGQDNPRFEGLKLLSTGLAWSPDGKQLAIAVKSGPGDAIALVDIKTRKSVHYRIPEIEAIFSLDWSPDGSRIAFSASDGPQSDIYVLDLNTRETVNLTHDLFSDLNPSWSPDGKYLVFQSDRGSHVLLGAATERAFDMVQYDYGQYDLYRLELGASVLERLTYDETWDEVSPEYGSDPDRILFISDRNGIYNLYEKNLVTGEERPLTNVLVGIMEVALSRDGSRAAVVSLKEGTPSIYLIKSPFERTVGERVLPPNVWAQRVEQNVEPQAPALALASAAALENNPLLRSARSGVPYVRHDLQMIAQMIRKGRPAPVAQEEPQKEISPVVAQKEDTAEEADTSAYGSVRVDFRNYVFSDAFEEAHEEIIEEEVNKFNPKDNVTPEGRFKPKKYKLSFSPDLVYGFAGYDNLYGMQSVTQMMFSDMLGNHQIFAATNLLIDLRNSDYYLMYTYLPRRTDWSVFGYHIARIVPNYQTFAFYRFRYYGGGIAARYPLDKFRRFDLSVGLLGISQTDITDPRVPTLSRTLFNPALTYTKDTSIPGFLYPTGGVRYAISLSGTPGDFWNSDAPRFVTLLGDFRWYGTLGRYYTLALRFSGGASIGKNPQLFYTSGVENWLYPSFDGTNGFPISDISDFVFATPVLPLRGYDINEQNGHYFALLNAEFRYPLVAALLPGPIPIFPLYNLQGVFFVDVGTVFGGVTNPRFDLYTYQNGYKTFDDLLIGVGIGIRTILLGYPIRLDYAWPYTGRGFGRRRGYLSIGFDF